MSKTHAPAVVVRASETPSGANARAVAISSKPTVRGIDLSKRSYFIHHTRNPDTGLYISKPLKRPFSGVWNLTFTRKIRDAEGAFNGVLLATVGLDYFTSFFEAVTTPISTSS